MFNIFNFSRKPDKLPFYTDIHCHVIPGVDDGSNSVEKSLHLLDHMHQWGINRVFASPHSTQDTFENTPQSLQKPFKELSDAIAANGPDIELHLHMEYRLDQFFIKQFENDNLLCLPGKHLLVENSYSTEPYGLEQLLFNIRNKGYRPIMAHPERYLYYSRNHRYRYEELHEFGLFFQVNLLSLAGHYGKLERETALYMLEHNLVQFIGTDIHRNGHIESIERYMKSRHYKNDLKYLSKLQNDSL